MVNGKWEMVKGLVFTQTCLPLLSPSPQSPIPNPKPMKNLKIKFLALYGVSICSVVILFQVVTGYGERNLKAPPAIKGHYRLEFTEKLPNCDTMDTLILNIQQSGIYLHGILLPEETDTKVSATRKTKPSLTGKLSSEELSLSGKVPKTTLCDNALIETTANSNLEDNYLTSITMQIPQGTQASSTGQIAVDGVAKVMEFTALPQSDQENSEN
ncbi:MAG: hypothetical protein QNJ47_19550 [Nostocaceae cyanobacterium]|nr:hypothetical protein [Nostocaceae cyanobacterium]